VIARCVRVLVLMAVLWTSVVADPRQAHAADAIEVQAAHLEPDASAGGWLLAADFVLPLPGRLADAINRGVALYFTVDFELSRSRWYWWDERILQASRTYRVSYHALTRQYRLTLDGLGRSFESLEDLLAALARLRGWRVVEPGQLRAGTEYEARVRMRLDTSLLPKPFQVSAITNRDWTLQAEWRRFKFTP